MILNNQADLLAMQHLNPLLQGYVPWTSSAMRPAAFVNIINDITVNDRRVVLELGGGVSTLLIAKL